MVNIILLDLLIKWNWYEVKIMYLKVLDLLIIKFMKHFIKYLYFNYLFVVLYVKNYFITKLVINEIKIKFIKINY